MIKKVDIFKGLLHTVRKIAKRLLRLFGIHKKVALVHFEPKGRSPEFNLWNISEFARDVLIPITGVRPFPMNELTLMVGAVVSCRPTHIFEWGTNVGVSARIFYETCKSLGWQIPIHSIDLPDDENHIEHPRNHRGRLVKNINQVTLHQGDGMDTSLATYKASRNKGRPLFFLDGDHSYESVRRELVGIFKAVPEASFLLHDTFFQSPESGYNIGPNKAVREFLAKHHKAFTVTEQNFGLPGMTFLRNMSVGG
jgi:cephalosporin hydroxylase